MFSLSSVKLAQPKHSGEESYPVNTEVGAEIWMEVALVVRESIFTIKNFTVGFTAPA
jgi:hypothetical protein